jgi:hypothetical protein
VLASKAGNLDSLKGSIMSDALWVPVDDSFEPHVVENMALDAILKLLPELDIGFNESQVFSWPRCIKSLPEVLSYWKQCVPHSNLLCFGDSGDISHATGASRDHQFEQALAGCVEQAKRPNAGAGVSVIPEAGRHHFSSRRPRCSGSC